MTVHSPLLNNVPVRKGRYSYQTHGERRRLRSESTSVTQCRDREHFAPWTRCVSKVIVTIVKLSVLTSADSHSLCLGV